MFFLYFLSFFIIIYFVNEPISRYSDKENYKLGFLNLTDSDSTRKSFDIGFYYLQNVIRSYTSSHFAYFFILAFIYLGGYLIFIKKFISKDYLLIYFLITITSLGFYSYGVNTIRQGLALSLFLIAIAYDRNNIVSLLFSIISFFFHKSLLIPILAFWILKKYNIKNNFVYLWMLCLLITVIFGSTLAATLGEFLGTSDSRLDSYLVESSQGYKTGFKFNFFLYSLAPIIYGFKINSKINDPVYSKMLSLYVIVNAVWLLVIRIPFTDRFAYLSWVLIPFILVYPLTKYQIFKNKNLAISVVLIYLSLISFLIS